MVRRGLTVVELTVAAAVAAVAVGLALAAVQKVRASADRVRCGNNVRQVALAAHAYDEVSAHLPPAGGVGLVRTPAGRYRPMTGSLHYFLLPFVGHEPLQWSVAGAAPDRAYCTCGEHAAARAASPAGVGWARDASGLDFHPGHATPKVFRCPADPSSADATGLVSRARVGVTQYAAAAPPLGNHRYGTPRAAVGTGFPDGTSQSVVLAERYGRCGGVSPNWLGDEPLADAPGFGFRYDWPDPQTEVIEPPQVAPAVADCDPETTQSPHPGAVLAGMADGSLRAFGPGLSADTWRALVRPDDGQTVDPR